MRLDEDVMLGRYFILNHMLDWTDTKELKNVVRVVKPRKRLGAFWAGGPSRTLLGDENTASWVSRCMRDSYKEEAP